MTTFSAELSAVCLFASYVMASVSILKHVMLVGIGGSYAYCCCMVQSAACSNLAWLTHGHNAFVSRAFILKCKQHLRYFVQYESSRDKRITSFGQQNLVMSAKTAKNRSDYSPNQPLLACEIPLNYSGSK
jgi:hypothetical protein